MADEIDNAGGEMEPAQDSSAALDTGASPESGTPSESPQPIRLEGDTLVEVPVGDGQYETVPASKAGYWASGGRNYPQRVDRVNQSLAAEGIAVDPQTGEVIRLRQPDPVPMPTMPQQPAPMPQPGQEDPVEALFKPYLDRATGDLRAEITTLKDELQQSYRQTAEKEQGNQLASQLHDQVNDLLDREITAGRLTEEQAEQLHDPMQRWMQTSGDTYGQAIYDEHGIHRGYQWRMPMEQFVSDAYQWARGLMGDAAALKEQGKQEVLADIGTGGAVPPGAPNPTKAGSTQQDLKSMSIDDLEEKAVRDINAILAETERTLDGT